jgi:hypothetical protein
VVSQLSTGDGFVYTYAKDARGWYFAALDFRTGGVSALSRVPLSNVVGGALANNYYSGLGIGPDGSAYVGVFGGIVAWRPGRIPSGRSSGAPQVFEVGPLNTIPGSVSEVLGDGIGEGPVGAAKARVFTDAGFPVQAGPGPQTVPLWGNAEIPIESSMRPAYFRRAPMAAGDGDGENPVDLVLGTMPARGVGMLGFDPLSVQQLEGFFGSISEGAQV